MYPTQTLLQLHSWISHYPRFSQIQRYYCILSHRVASYPYSVVLYQYSVAIYRMYCIASYRNAMYFIEFVPHCNVSHHTPSVSQCITSYLYRVAMYRIIFVPRRSVSYRIRTTTECIASYSYHVVSCRIAMYHILFVPRRNVSHHICITSPRNVLHHPTLP